MKKDSVWIKCFGQEENGEDAFGVIVNYYEYQTKSDKSWTIDHIWPLSLEGSNDIRNCQVLAYSSNQKKKNLLQGKINNFPFSVKKITKDKNKIIGRTKIKINGEWYWAYNE